MTYSGSSSPPKYGLNYDCLPHQKLICAFTNNDIHFKGRGNHLKRHRSWNVNVTKHVYNNLARCDATWWRARTSQAPPPEIAAGNLKLRQRAQSTTWDILLLRKNYYFSRSRLDFQAKSVWNRAVKLGKGVNGLVIRIHLRESEMYLGYLKKCAEMSMFQ